ncbi:hypothetical protein DICPUDRAFT_84765 [Dictyostelium purpureum]|uniref:Uncharacterized protein n=1 Tax=Dictyostelium purpureum TaxID=5786 RepID=F1A3N7_DICPU|nr:uncharacterized protein DICPUDRAFT_84765 [Dictyostelium purpureum]EGC29198.1 hypothetical protein DICPUDRAFT_84765 [Dictyostelium purpureum]|eukprot:XP_003294281.1 hypothetical protein DICPUDRAFT_84765 [Dictyostelium purpureum]
MNIDVDDYFKLTGGRAFNKGQDEEEWVLNSNVIRGNSKGEHYIELQYIVYAHHRAVSSSESEVSFKNGVESLLKIGKLFNETFPGTIPEETNKQKSNIVDHIIKNLWPDKLNDENFVTNINLLAKKIKSKNHFPALKYMYTNLNHGQKMLDRMVLTEEEFNEKYPGRGMNADIPKDYDTYIQYMIENFGEWVNKFVEYIKNYLDIIKKIADAYVKISIYIKLKQSLKKISQ